MISNYGDVYNNITNRLMKTYTNKAGYILIDLAHKGVKEKTSIHRLVALHFCDGYVLGLVVNHIDGNNKNNYYKNLEWVTQRENILDTIKRGTFNITNAQEVAKEKNKKKIIAIDPKTLEHKHTFSSLKEAKVYLGGSPNISRALKDGTLAKGYLWEYKK